MPTKRRRLFFDIEKNLVYLVKSKNMKDVFYLPKYYQIEIDRLNNEIKVYSNSKHAKGRELKQYLTPSGYLSVKVNNKSETIHSLVAKFYIGERPKNLCVNHKDGNKLNNMPENLEYVTISENIKHSILNGMHICNRPELINSYIDGRCRDIVKYKHNWYLNNREKILNKAKARYNERKKTRTI